MPRCTSIAGSAPRPAGAASRPATSRVVHAADAAPGWSSGGGWSDGPDVVVADHGLDPDHGTGVGGHDHVAGADVHADVVDRAGIGEDLGPEHQIAGLEGAWVQDSGAGVPLLAGGPRELDP